MPNFSADNTAEFFQKSVQFCPLTKLPTTSKLRKKDKKKKQKKTKLKNELGFVLAIQSIVRKAHIKATSLQI